VQQKIVGDFDACPASSPVSSVDTEPMPFRPVVESALTTTPLAAAKSITMTVELGDDGHHRRPAAAAGRW
jgi:hypothetical protein